MSFSYTNGLTPYNETRYMQGRAQHKPQPEMHATAPYKFPNATLDEGSTLIAINTLMSSLPLPVLKHIVQLPPKCIEALLLLLDQVQNNISLDWLTNVLAALDPEEKRITVSQSPSQVLQDDGSFWTDSSATTCHVSALNVDRGMELSDQSSNVPSTYEAPSSFYYEATMPSNSFETDAFTYNANAISIADTAIMHSPFDGQLNNSHLGSGLTSARNDLQFEGLPNCDFILIDSVPTGPNPEEMKPFAAPFPPLQDNPSKLITETKRSNTVRQRRSRRSTKGSYQDDSLNILMFKMPQGPVEEHRSPCPYCDSAFVSHTEFAAHIVATHDQPVTYQCSHVGCDFVTCRLTLLGRHHTNYHRNCPVSPPHGVSAVTSCRQEQHKSQPRKIWGCWLCTWETRNGAESWAHHQLEQHKGCQREDLSHTWLIKSLLSQSRLRSTWQAEIRQLEKATNTIWNLTWSDSRADPARDCLIQALETGLWQGKNYLIDDDARHALIKAAMEATRGTREALDHAYRHDKGSSKRPLSPAPMSMRRLRSFGQNLRNRFTHEALPAPDTSSLISMPRRQDSLPIRSSGRNRPATSHEIT